MEYVNILINHVLINQAFLPLLSIMKNLCISTSLKIDIVINHILSSDCKDPKR